MNLQTVLLLFGGESSEHEVSVSSARNVYAAIDDEKFNVILGYIDKTGKWWQLDTLGMHISTHGASQLVPVFGSKSFITLPNNRVITPDVILPILHGKNGEDGSVQGVAQLLHIPIAGCDMAASAICMDKMLTKEIMRVNDIKTVPYERHLVGEPMPDFNRLSMRLGSPLFVKPSRGGSSIGGSKVFTEEELALALKLAHQHDSVALIEAGLTARELEVAVLGNPPHHKASGVAEVIPPDGDFYSYEAKYSGAAQTKIQIPADLSEEVVANVRALALKAYTLLGCRGIARVDFFLDQDGMLYLNEVNTLPGFTNTSVYPKLWRQENLAYSELIERFISLALEDTIKADKTEE